MLPATLGATSGQATIYIRECSLKNSLIKPDSFLSEELVKMSTVDIFASEHNIKRIDLLKIDTEGFDLEVLKGAENMLASGRVSFVLTEVGFHLSDKSHILFDEVRKFLLEKGFSVFGFYGQTLEWSGERRLRFADTLFAYEHTLSS